MKIEQLDDGKNGRFYYVENGEELAEMTYVYAGDDKIIIDHTEVHESLKGKGVGKELVKSGVEFARAKGLKVIPLCPFAKKMIELTKEWQDVL